MYVTYTRIDNIL